MQQKGRRIATGGRTAVHRARVGAVLVSSTLMGVYGCQHGPKAMQVSYQDYGAAVQQSRSEQMLTNLVRLRYHEYPVFLQVGSISASPIRALGIRIRSGSFFVMSDSFFFVIRVISVIGMCKRDGRKP